MSGGVGDDCRLILHVGLPKGGSSALQTALSRSPELTTAAGRRLRYTALGQSGDRPILLYGAELELAARRSAYGYAAWPNMRAGEADSPVFAQLRRAMEAGRKEGSVPIASCEGWISRPGLFARFLESCGHPPVEVVAFLRPPVDWVNAAYWQWGVWITPDLDLWLKRGNLPYGFGPDLEGWARIPNLRLRLGNARPDVVGRFAELYGVDLPGAASSNSSSPPALVGFLLRNRAFRASGHDASTEFVVQRWCPPVAGRRLWALRARHVSGLRATVQRNRAALRRVATRAEFEEILSDARWSSELPYHPALHEGPCALDDRAEMAALHGALLEGAARACAAAGMRLPPLPDLPAVAAPVAQWDAALRPPIEALLKADAALRQALRPGLRGMGQRVRRAFGA